MIAEVFAGLQDGLLAMTASPFALLLLFALCFVDGFFPPVPSETIVISLAAVAASGQGPPLILVLLIAAAGAFAGDLTAYAIGTKLPLERIPIFKTGRGKSALEWARSQIGKRGGSLILAARYVPIGRVAVNVTAGSIGYPFRKFALFAALAGLSWGAFSVVIGVGAGTLVAENPLLASLIGIVVGVGLGWVIEAVLRARSAAAERRQTASQTGSEPGARPGPHIGPHIGPHGGPQVEGETL